MTAITVPNHDGDGAADRPDGALPRYELLHAGFTRRSYADDPADLIDVLAPGYADSDADRQWTLRLEVAAAAQVAVQAYLNATPAWLRLPAADRDILDGPRHEPPVVPHWDCVVPLVLIRTYYTPAGTAPAPQRRNGMDPNVIWIDPSDDLSLLTTLHLAGHVALHEIE